MQKVLYTAQNVRLRVGCAKSALYSTKCTPESGMCKKCSIQHKMYAREWDVQKVLYTAQNVRSRVGCAISALCSTKCMPESGIYRGEQYSSSGGEWTILTETFVITDQNYS